MSTLSVSASTPFSTEQLERREKFFAKLNGLEAETATPEKTAETSAPAAVSTGDPENPTTPISILA